jgi:hypothetical protein
MKKKKPKERNKRKRMASARKKANPRERKRVTMQAPQVIAGPAAKSDAAPLAGVRQRQKLLRIAEAMREQGAGEDAFGNASAYLLNKLVRGEKPNGSEKLLLDLLKEIVRLLEPNSSAATVEGCATDGPVVLVHDIPRPVRTRAATVDAYASDARETI